MGGEKEAERDGSDGPAGPLTTASSVSLTAGTTTAVVTDGKGENMEEEGRE